MGCLGSASAVGARESGVGGTALLWGGPISALYHGVAFWNSPSACWGPLPISHCQGLSLLRNRPDFAERWSREPGKESFWPRNGLPGARGTQSELLKPSVPRSRILLQH